MAECVICLEPLVRKARSNGVERLKKVCAISQCGHTYHLSCLQEWLKTKKECPTCRKPDPRFHEIYLTSRSKEFKDSTSPRNCCTRSKSECEKLRRKVEDLEFEVNFLKQMKMLMAHKIGRLESEISGLRENQENSPPKATSSFIKGKSCPEPEPSAATDFRQKSIRKPIWAPKIDLNEAFLHADEPQEAVNVNSSIVPSRMCLGGDGRKKETVTFSNDTRRRQSRLSRSSTTICALPPIEEKDEEFTTVRRRRRTSRNQAETTRPPPRRSLRLLNRASNVS